MELFKRWLGAVQLSLFENERVVTEKNSVKNRHMVINGQVVPYYIERTRRKTVGMLIDSQGLRVRASQTVTITEIERILYSKSTWLLKHLHKQGQPKPPVVSFVPDLNLADGDALVILGREIVVCWSDQKYSFDAHRFLHENEMQLILNTVEPSKRQQVLLKALSEILYVYFNERATQIATQFKLSYSSILLSNAKTLWGTCRSDGTIRLSWRLAFVPQALADYVLIHELAHTVHMNHSAQFWAQVELMCPSYKEHVKALKKYNLRAAL